MAQTYQPKRFQGSPEERRQVMLNAAHLLNKLRGYAEEVDCPLSGKDEETFWQFISLLPMKDQGSVIN